MALTVCCSTKLFQQLNLTVVLRLGLTFYSLSWVNRLCALLLLGLADTH